jgi:ubiquinone/menaquinone biosynthesis C-methylase UbiE
MAQTAPPVPLFRYIREFYQREAVYARIQRFLAKKAPPTVVFDGMEIIKKSEQTDAQILWGLKKLWEPHNIEATGRHATTGREESRLKDIARELGTIRESMGEDFTYLDIGSAEGEITALIAKSLGLRQNQAYASDITPPKKTSEVFTFQASTPDKLPYADQSFDLVTMFVAAHHFTDADTMFKETNRVMTPGAHLLMREHDCASETSSLFYNVVHAFYDCIFNEEKTPEEFVKNYYAHYRGKNEWISFARQHGFELVDMHTSIAGNKFIKDMYDSVYIFLVKS